MRFKTVADQVGLILAYQTYYPQTVFSCFESVCLFVAGHQKQVSPDLFRVFYTIWKETEAEAQEVCTVLYTTLNKLRWEN